MNIDPRWVTLFEKGFPLEKPDLVLPWGQSLAEVARLGGGIQQGDLFLWPNATYLKGLKYPLFSDRGLSASDSFHEITAYIGLTPEGWTDQTSREGFDHVASHLSRLFGEPTERHIENDLGERDIAWQVGSLHFYLGIIEQFALKCYLTIRDPESLRTLHSN